MTTLTAAISWSDSDVVLSLFVLWPTGDRGEIVPPQAPVKPRSMRSYDLEDVREVLGDIGTSELDLIFDAVPTALDGLVEAWLAASMRAGAIVAWFGFEGSFDFDHILTADVADQIYGVACAGVIALATDDRRRASVSWVKHVEAVRRTVL